MSDTFLLDQINRTLGVDLRQANVSSANGRHRPRKTPSVAVEHRQRPKIDGAIGESVLDNLSDGIDVAAAMRVHHTLGRAGGSAGVVDGDDIVLANLVRRHRRAAFAQEFLVVGDNAFDLGNLTGDREQRQDQIVPDQDLRAAVVEDRRQFGALQANVEHDQHRANQRDGEVRFQCQQTVARQHGNAISGSNARVLKSRSESDYTRCWNSE